MPSTHGVWRHTEVQFLLSGACVRVITSPPMLDSDAIPPFKCLAVGFEFHEHQAAIAQLGERQTEDLKVPGAIPGLGRGD